MGRSSPSHATPSPGSYPHPSAAHILPRQKSDYYCCLPQATNSSAKSQSPPATHSAFSTIRDRTYRPAPASSTASAAANTKPSSHDPVGTRHRPSASFQSCAAAGTRPSATPEQSQSPSPPASTANAHGLHPPNRSCRLLSGSHLRWFAAPQMPEPARISDPSQHQAQARIPQHTSSARSR